MVPAPNQTLASRFIAAIRLTVTGLTHPSTVAYYFTIVPVVFIGRALYKWDT